MINLQTSASYTIRGHQPTYRYSHAEIGFTGKVQYKFWRVDSRGRFKHIQLSENLTRKLVSEAYAGAYAGAYTKD